MDKDCSIDELINILKDNKITNKSTSKDTVRLTINTLKDTGCVIEKPSKLNNYKYKLISHPFVLNISEKELNALIHLRENYTNNINWKEINTINSIYEKIGLLTEKKTQIEIIENTKPLRNIDYKILYEISKPQVIGKKVNITYISPEFGKEDIDIIPRKINYENQKLYLQCFNFKYNSNSTLNIERILKINNINFSNNFELSIEYEVKYKLSGNSLKTFELKDYEKIIEKTNNYIIINAKVSNEFLFIQRILQFGNDFNIISPDFFREKLLEKLKLIKRGYES